MEKYMEIAGSEVWIVSGMINNFTAVTSLLLLPILYL